jgi:nucleoside-diphosphate-sugar epimerase
VKKLFITGVSGCVGHYIFDLLSKTPDYQFYLLVRDPRKLKFNPADHPNVVIIQDDLKNIKDHGDIIRQMDLVIHAAADWGGNEGNYDYTLSLFKLIDPARCQRVIYFSTASILGADGRPLEEAERFGTHYIRSKYRIYNKLTELPIKDKIYTLFPTWILGGGKSHPYSHAAQGLLDMEKWLWLIRFFTIPARFHFIHARDIALVVKYLLEHPSSRHDFVLGNEAVSASRFIEEVCRFFGKKVYFRLPITLPVIRLLAFLTRRTLHPWDMYCFARRDFVYQTVDPASFGIDSKLNSVEAILDSLTENRERLL